MEEEGPDGVGLAVKSNCMHQPDAVHSPQPLMRRVACLLAIAVLLLATSLARPAFAQTYSPKSIHFESTDASEHLDSAELLRITGLQQGVPLTKAEIEAGLEKLGASGAFSNLSYTVNDTALTVRLTPAGGGQALPVRFANFVWWQHDELIRLLEARIPLFHGMLPLQGNQTGEVEDVLVGLLRAKGIPNAQITAMPSTSKPGGPMDTVALSITSPEILVGETRFDGGIPAVSGKLTTLDREFAGREFDRQDITNSIQQSVQEIFQDAGYLDIANDLPVFATPRKDLDRYVVDAQVTLRPGTLYRINAVTLHPEPPLSDAALRAVLPFKAGDPASASDFRGALMAFARAYADYGYLRAHAGATVNKSNATHTISYSFTFAPGAQFHLASIDTSGLPSDLQQEFASLWNVPPGVLCDKTFREKLRSAVHQLHSRSAIYVVEQGDDAAHTVIIRLQLHKAMGAGLGSDGDPSP